MSTDWLAGSGLHSYYTVWAQVYQRKVSRACDGQASKYTVVKALSPQKNYHHPKCLPVAQMHVRRLRHTSIRQ